MLETVNFTSYRLKTEEVGDSPWKWRKMNRKDKDNQIQKEKFGTWHPTVHDTHISQNTFFI